MRRRGYGGVRPGDAPRGPGGGRRPTGTPENPLEKVVQSNGLNLLRSLGASLYVLGTKRKRGDYQGTRQTPGISDVHGFLPRPRYAPPQWSGAHELIAFWWEAKRTKGSKRSEEQIDFADECRRAGIAHVTGDVDALIAWLIAGYWLKAENVAHYRQPKD